MYYQTFRLSTALTRPRAAPGGRFFFDYPPLSCYNTWQREVTLQLENQIDYNALMQRHSRLSLVPLILGVVGLLLSLWPAVSIAGFPIALAGWIVGLFGRRYSRKSNIPEDKKNAIGRTCGLVGTLISLFLTLLVLLAVMSGS